MMAASVNTKDDILDKGAHSDRGGLWFGPRLGKRSFSQIDEENRETFLRLLEAADALKYYYDQLPNEMQSDAPPSKVIKKVIFTPKLGRAVYQENRYENVEFTPRLGRKLPERIPATFTVDEDRADQVMADSRSNFFSPRLGRNFKYSPRLGRELLYDLYPESQIRVVRSINKTKST
ncbi:unnamed protein product, partial [Brenthis ino]